MLKFLRLWLRGYQKYGRLWRLRYCPGFILALWRVGGFATLNKSMEACYRVNDDGHVPNT